MAAIVRSNIVQVTNVSPSANSEQLRTLFGHIGVLDEFVIYPSDEKEESASKVAFIRYHEPINAEVALHLNNTVFLDRALVVLPLANGMDTIPDEKYANLVRAPANTAAGVLPRTADWPLDVISMVVGRPGEQVIHTIEPRLSTLAFPLYPPLAATTDGNRIEEIRRTILVTNLDPKTTGDQVLDFFNKHAEVRCVRMAGTEFDRAAYVEFTQQPSIVKAFGLMGATLNGRQIMVQHSNCAIIKPANNFALVDDGSKTAATTDSKSSDHRKYSDRGRTRSRSKGRRSRSRKRSTSRRRRTRSRDRRRSHSRHGRRRSRTRSRSHARRRHSRSVSRDRRRSNRVRSRSRDRRKYHRSRSRSERRRSVSRSRGRRGDRRDRGSVRSGRDRNRDKDRRERDSEKDRRRERDRDRRKDSKSRKHRDESPRPTSDLNDSMRQEIKDQSSSATIHNSGSPHRPSSDVGHSSLKNTRHGSSGTSYASGSDSEDDSAVNKTLDQQSPTHVNGKSENEDSSQLCETNTKPLVVGVKLAGPEDMDNLSPNNPTSDQKSSPEASNDSDSSDDAMDTEA
ncbi:hypothetical protein AHF37_07143 [Paragonimus kellicotti]|nr:hypothetical protein AHF37_07143 [Paragonimus kellicotti]